MAEWRDAQLSELIDIKHGFAFKGEFFTDEPTGDILVTPGNFAIGGGFQLSKPKFYNGPVPKEYVLNPGDVIVTMTDLSKQADTLGYSAVVPVIKPRLLHNQRIGRVIAKDASANLGFIAWLMRTRPYRHEIVGGATGSTVKHTSPGRILAHRFKLPSPKEQQDIVDVLQPLDEKIELNRRMNETLEGMAQAIFRDWFVDFGPVRRAQAGEADPVAIMGGLTPDPARAAHLAALFPAAFGSDGLPVGWSKQSIYAAASVIYGAPFASKRFNSDGIGRPLVRIRDLPRHGSELFTDEVHSREYVIQPGDIVVGMDGEFRARVWQGIPSLMNQRVCCFQPKSPDARAFVYFSIKPTLDHMEKSAVGTTVIHLGKGDIDRFTTIDPGEELIAAFGGIAEVMLDRLTANGLENRTLAETRDYLLPRLMSGAVRVAPQAEAA